MADAKNLLSEGMAAPDFTAPSTEGDITLSALRGRTLEYRVAGRSGSLRAAGPARGPLPRHSG